MQDQNVAPTMQILSSLNRHDVHACPETCNTRMVAVCRHLAVKESMLGWGQGVLSWGQPCWVGVRSAELGPDAHYHCPQPSTP